MKTKKINHSQIAYGQGMPLIPEPVQVFLLVRNVNLALDATPNTPDNWLVRKDNAETPVDREFAEIVLQVLEDWTLKLGFDGIAHLGVFNSRMARTVSGKPINRISRHAYGRAIDFKGFVLGDKFIPFTEVPQMKEIISVITALAKSRNFNVEELIEGKTKAGKTSIMSWWHIGIYH